MITKSNNAGGRWLVVDDNPEIRALTCYMVMLLTGVQPEAFRNGAEAFAAVQAAPESVELVLTDLEMPGMNGMELCRQLRAVAPALGVVLITGRAWFSRETVRELGFDGMVRKPFHVQELAEVLNATRQKFHNALGATVVA